MGDFRSSCQYNLPDDVSQSVYKQYNSRYLLLADGYLLLYFTVAQLLIFAVHCIDNANDTIITLIVP